MNTRRRLSLLVWLVAGAGCSSRPDSSGQAAAAGATGAPGATATPGAPGAPGATGAPAASGPAASASPGLLAAPGRVVDLYGDSGVGGARALRKGGDRAADQELLRRVFPRFLASVDRCPLDAGPTDRAFRDGLFVPAVTARLAGAFTAAGVSEEALGVSVGECGATHAEGFGSQRLLVRRGGQVVAQVATKGHPAAAVDIDGDGRHELLFEGGGTGQGVVVVSLVLARVEGDRLAVIRDFGVVREDTCGAPSPDGDEVTRVQAVTRDGVLDFELTRERRACR